ncbi:MAG: hypothetical protein GY873_15495 [Bosea sp.]|uniref:hypothetical protein n=1 Tax=Bosea sp. (in: a-proteobacteria) TaxID=1871050 RepID=UPI00239C2AF0|nr:hypothetical protein [Bosea sp. (in: a-proteobacteria)]MCP4735588.1 hypothetical protein [Bosea sp. (in: a-proteobacteria)]
MCHAARLSFIAAFAALAIHGAGAQERFEDWPPLTNPFPSTGGGGIMIHDYDPVVAGGKCGTRFRAVEPNGTTYHNLIEFEASETQGGVLCSNGRWRSADGSASGTTPFRVFIKDGVRRGSPQ